MGAAVPTLVGVSMFTAVQQVDRMLATEKTKKELYMEALEPAKAFEDLDFEDAVEVPSVEVPNVEGGD